MHCVKKKKESRLWPL